MYSYSGHRTHTPAARTRGRREVHLDRRGRARRQGHDCLRLAWSGAGAAYSPGENGCLPETAQDPPARQGTPPGLAPAVRKGARAGSDFSYGGPLADCPAGHYRYQNGRQEARMGRPQGPLHKLAGGEPIPQSTLPHRVESLELVPNAPTPGCCRNLCRRPLSKNGQSDKGSRQRIATKVLTKFSSHPGNPCV